MWIRSLKGFFCVTAALSAILLVVTWYLNHVDQTIDGLPLFSSGQTACVVLSASLASLLCLKHARDRRWIVLPFLGVLSALVTAVVYLRIIWGDDCFDFPATLYPHLMLVLTMSTLVMGARLSPGEWFWRVSSLVSFAALFSLRASLYLIESWELRRQVADWLMPLGFANIVCPLFVWLGECIHRNEGASRLRDQGASNLEVSQAPSSSGEKPNGPLPPA